MAVSPRARSTEGTKNPGILRIERGGYLYTFNLLTGTGALFDEERDPRHLRNLARDRPEEARRLRGLLSERHGVVDLEELRDPEDREIKALRGLGYL